MVDRISKPPAFRAAVDARPANRRVAPDFVRVNLEKESVSQEAAGNSVEPVKDGVGKRAGAWARKTGTTVNNFVKTQQAASAAAAAASRKLDAKILALNACFKIYAKDSLDFTLDGKPATLSGGRTMMNIRTSDFHVQIKYGLAKVVSGKCSPERLVDVISDTQSALTKVLH